MRREDMVRAAALPIMLFVVPSAIACMGIGEPGATVRFAGQTNIIVWDKKHRVEHFIRDARFQTSGKSLGFIAPTPTPPTIEAVDRAAFDQLSALGPSRGYPGGYAGGFGGGAGGGVSVIATKQVAGYEATVLQASNPYELSGWLQRNGFSVPRFATQWASLYIAKRWYFTAFRVAAGGGYGATGPVRLTFRTDAPYNPYSVPAENGGGSGLSLYYVSAGDEQAKIGGLKPWVSPKWTAPLKDEAAGALAASLHLPPVAVPQGSTVRLYRDSAFGRPGFDDIFFVERPTRVFPHGVGDLVGIGALVLCVSVWPTRSRAKLHGWRSTYPRC